MPTVSVIIPTYNRAQLLAFAVLSVLNQTYQDFELIVVDDGSSDNTVDVVTGFRDNRIRLIRHSTSKGGAAARNTGIRSSIGDYLAFLDDDDEWLPDKLRLQMNIFRVSSSTIGCVYTGYLYIERSSGSVISRTVPQKKGDLSEALLRGNCLGSGGSSVVLTRECINAVGMFDEDLPSYQDYDLWIRISKQFSFDYVVEPLVRVYVHNNSISKNWDAVNSGIDIMLKKHGSSTSLRKYLSYRSLNVGVSYCLAGNLPSGRSAYLRAIALYPLEIRHYVNLALSFCGSRQFTRVKESPVWRGVASVARRKLDYS
jgi:glycosyltransferase involved in cell wall biosynthesis